MLVNRDTPREKSQAEFGRWCGMVKKGGRDFGALRTNPHSGEIGCGGNSRIFLYSVRTPPKTPPDPQNPPSYQRLQTRAGLDFLQNWVPLFIFPAS